MYGRLLLVVDSVDPFSSVGWNSANSLVLGSSLTF